MKRALHSPWLVALAVLVLAAIPVLAALAAQREQTRRAEALLFERSADVVAGYLRLLSARQMGWQNGQRMRISNRADAPEKLLDTVFAPASAPEHWRALGYGALEEGRVVLRWSRTKRHPNTPALGEDLLALPQTAPLLRAATEQPAQMVSVQNGPELLTAMTVGGPSPRHPRGWLVAWWDLETMCSDLRLDLVATDQTLTARPFDGALRPGERVVDVGEAEARWQAVVGRGVRFAALFPHMAERAIAITGGSCAVLLALLAGLATRAAGLRAALGAERELVAMKDHLLRSVSHEFRTPLSVILSSTELLENYSERLPPARRAEALAEIRQSTARMNEMVGQVLLLSRLEARRVPVQPKALDVAGLVGDLARATGTATQARCLIQVTAPATLEATLDPTLLRAVLGNLLSNAVKFSPEGGPVEFSVERGERLRFVIRDTGPGIAAADLARVREPFFRAASAHEISGTGLGLTIADECAALLKGTLVIASNPAGTTATFTL